jgi:outer membrane receptor protein involved in Fe transport
MNIRESGLSPLLVRAAVSAALGMNLLATIPAASAAEEAVEEEKITELAEVQITGSRIVRRDYEANSPLVSVDSAALEQRAGLNVESFLNQLPSYNPAASPNVKGGSGSNSDVQISAVNSVGIASVSLRGFGPNRSLVLIDGRRATPTNALMVVDVNGIPSSMIKRVEIISGGASATYGADAIGGVSNFLLRRDFEGLELDTQWGITEVGDGQEMRTSATFGTGVGDGRGNVVFSGEYYDRQASMEKNRSFFLKGWADPTTATNAPNFFGLNAYNTTTSNAPSANTLRAILAGRPAGTDVYAFGTTGNNTLLRFNPNSTIYNATGNNSFSFGLPIDGYRYAYQNSYDSSLCNTTSTTVCPNGPTAIQTLKYLETEGYVNAPQTRYSFMATGKYDFNDALSFNASARFAQSTTRTYLASSTGGGGWAASVNYNANVDSPVVPQGTVVGGTAVDYTNAATVATVLANPAAYANPNFIAHGAANAQHPVPLQLAILLNSRPANTLWCLTGTVGCAAANATTDRNLVGTARLGRDSPWQAETYLADSFVGRNTVNSNATWQVEAGLNYKLPFGDWTSELYYSRGESAIYNKNNGNRSLARWRALISAADYGRNSRLQSNLTNNPSTTSPGFGSVPVPCTSGFYELLFNGDAKPSDDCVYAVNAPLQTRTENQQDITELNFQGGLFTLPAGQVRTALGFQYRRNASQFTPDILQSTASFTDQVIGVYPTGYLEATTRAKDVYAELLLPVVADVGFLKKVELEIGGRHSDYDQTDSTWTYKFNGSVELGDYLRFRGGYNRATRAPNLGEMFLPLQELFTAGGTFGDPCGLLSNAPFGAGGATGTVLPLPSQAGTPANIASGQTAAGALSSYLICQAQMGATGANTFYNVTPQTANGAGAGGALTFVYQTGNPNLESEVADTWTAGVVVQSPFQHQLLSKLTATIDWYKIAIDDAILPYSMDYARFLCYGSVQVADPAAALAQANSTACGAVPRDRVSGAAQTTLVSYDNQARVRTSGIDFTLNWAAQLADMGVDMIPGGIGLGVQGTRLGYYKTKQSPYDYDPVVDWKGSLGPNLSGFNAGSYSYRLLTSFSYNLPSLSVSLRWRHLPSVITAAKGLENAIIENNDRVFAGGAGSMLSYTPSSARDVAAYDVFDLSGYWTINERLSLRFGIDNVFDKDPSITGATSGRPYDTSLSAAANAAALSGLCPNNSATRRDCVAPTSYSLGSSGQGSTSGGYYDTLGRRVYVGLKARF